VTAKDYGIAEVANLLGLSLAEVRRCVRDGILTAQRSEGGEVRLSFQDLVVLRKAAALVSMRVPPVQVRKALRNLREQLPTRPLSGITVHAEGSAVLVRDGRAIWNPVSNQLHLNFDEAPMEPPTLLHKRRPTRDQKLEADRLYESACDLERYNEAAAVSVYQKVLEAHPEHVEARINLGRIYHSQGHLEAAEAEYRLVLKQNPGHPIAAFNLAVLLEDMRRPEDAVATYVQALAVDDTCADAHFNISRLYERLGDRQAALRHLKAYRRLSRPPPTGKA
jgi:excisionase family DNA binding protein